MAVSIAPGQENTGLQKSSGKRCRTTFHKDEGSANKRQALVCLSNRAELAIRREEVPNKTVSTSMAQEDTYAVFFHYHRG